MIRDIKIWRYDELCSVHRPNSDVYISVTELGMQNLVAPRREPHILPLQFGDCGGYCGTGCNNDQGQIKGPDIRVKAVCDNFTPELAQEVIKFLDDNRYTDGDKTLHVNCMAGKSRSGAIGYFAAWYLGLNIEAFKNNNPRIVPNVHILTTLVKNTPA